MKRLFFILSAIALMISQAFISYADENNSIYASNGITNDIQTNMYDDSSSYSFIFGTRNVRIDFNSAIPVYHISKYSQENDYKYFSDIIDFTDRYAIPVYNKDSNKFLGLAKFGKIMTYDELPDILKLDDYTSELSLQHAGEWEIKSFSNDKHYKNLIYQIENNDIPADNVYYVEIENLNRCGLLYVSLNENGELIENFLDVSNANNTSTYSNNVDNNLYVTGKELLEEIDYVERSANDEIKGNDNVNFNTSLDNNVKSYSINWTVAPNKTIRSANEYSLKAGDIINFDIAISPAMDTSELKIGIYNIDTRTSTYLSHTSTSLSGKYTIRTDGNYKIIVKNLSNDKTATINGKYSIEQ